MVERIAVDFDTLRQHAKRVGMVEDGVRLAENAAGSLNLSGGAFGVMCSFLVTPATLVSGVAMSAISSSAGMLQRAQKEIRAVASEFEDLEQEIVTAYRQLEGGLDGGQR